MQQKSAEFEKRHQVKEKKAAEVHKLINDAKANQQKKDLMSGQFDTLVEDYEKAEVMVTQRVKSYVADRNNEYKHFVQHLISMQVAKHAHSLQVLSELSQEVEGIK